MRVQRRYAVRPARSGDAQAATQIAIASKAHWGYDEAFMALARPAITVTEDLIAEHCVGVIDGSDQDLAAVVSLMPGEAKDALELGHVFVAPAYMGLGLGRLLLEWAIEKAKAQGAVKLEILSDVHARPFYEQLGAKHIRDEPSDAIPGRFLPYMELDI